MKDFFQSTKFKILAAVFVVLCAFMLRATMSGGLTPLTSQLLSVVTTPLQSAASGVSESVGGLYRHLFQAGEIEEENAQLEEKVRTLTQQVADLERYRRENEQLREYLEIKEEHSDFSFASASVIGRDTAERFYSFTIDAGSEAGIEKFDPVITSDGLVGLVSEVGKNYAKVLTILDTTIEVGAYDIRTGTSAPPRAILPWPGTDSSGSTCCPRTVRSARATLSIPPVTADCTPRILPSARSPRSIPIPAA